MGCKNSTLHAIEPITILIESKLCGNGSEVDAPTTEPQHENQAAEDTTSETLRSTSGPITPPGEDSLQASTDQKETTNPDNTEENPLIEGNASWPHAAVKRCCGRLCEMQSSDRCCEHVFFTYTSPAHYCQTCRDRYVEVGEQSEDAKMPAEGSSAHTEGVPAKAPASEPFPLVEEAGPMIQESCPVCLKDFRFSSGALYVLPCKHAICHDHRHQIQKCPLCPIHEDDESHSTSLCSWDEDELLIQAMTGECRAQAGRYSIMHQDFVRSPRASVGRVYWEPEELRRNAWSSLSAGYAKSSGRALFRDDPSTTFEEEERERRYSC